MSRDSRKKRIVCELNASSASTAVVEAAIAHCRTHGAELVVVWVVDPATLRSPAGTAFGASGPFGLIGAHGLMLERLRHEGVVVASSVRVGESARMLEEERVAFGADEIFTAADVPLRRCPACGAREDPRAVHFCPTAHLGGAEPRRLRRTIGGTRAGSAPEAAARDAVR